MVFVIRILNVYSGLANNFQVVHDDCVKSSQVKSSQVAFNELLTIAQILQ